MFFLVGNGKFYNNRINNHQGNALRDWVVSVGDTPKSVEIFNNIVVESRGSILLSKLNLSSVS